MDLDTIVGVLVTIFAAKTFCKGCEGVGKTAVVLHLCTLVGSEATLAGDVLIDLIHIYKARAFVEKRTACVEFGFHDSEHFAYCRELDDSFAELATLECILVSLAVCELAHTYTLCGDTEAGTVHKSHHIFDEAHAA